MTTPNAFQGHGRRNIEVQATYVTDFPIDTGWWQDALDWGVLLSSDLYRALEAWSKFFNAHFDPDLDDGWDSREAREQFVLEGLRLVDGLRAEQGHRYKFTLILTL